MNQIQLIKVIPRVIEEVQFFLLANPDKYRSLTEPNSISYALIKLLKMGNVCQRHRKVAKAATIGSDKMVQVIGPHGRRL